MYSQYLNENFDEIVSGTISYIDMDMEPWEIGELMNDIYPTIKQKVPHAKLEIDAYKTYEEEYGGFTLHGILTIDTYNLSNEDMNFIKEMILRNLT